MSQGQALAQGLGTGGPSITRESSGLCVLALGMPLSLLHASALLTIADGGGVRGLSSLYILRTIMERVNDERNKELKDNIKPCDLFDLICGTSTGG